MQNNFPPPPVPAGFAPPPPVAAAPAPQFAPPPAQPYAHPPQGFAPPAPQGYALPDPDLNGISAGLNLLPQCTFEGVLRMTSYVKAARASGPAYTATFTVETSNAAEMPVGCTFTLLMKISTDPRKAGGDKSRKRLLAAVFGVHPDSHQDWKTIDLQLQQHDFNAQPLRMHLNQYPNYSNPVLDKTTRQPLPGQFWASQNWSRAQA